MDGWHEPSKRCKPTCVTFISYTQPPLHYLIMFAKIFLSRLCLSSIILIGLGCKTIRNSLRRNIGENTHGRRRCVLHTRTRNSKGQRAAWQEKQEQKQITGPPMQMLNTLIVPHKIAALNMSRFFAPQNRYTCFLLYFIVSSISVVYFIREHSINVIRIHNKLLKKMKIICIQFHTRKYSRSLCYRRNERNARDSNTLQKQHR